MKEKDKKLHSIILWEPVNRKIYLCLSRRQLKEQMEASYRKEYMRYVHQPQNPDGSTLKHVLVKWLNLGDKTKTKKPLDLRAKRYHLPKIKKQVEIWLLDNTTHSKATEKQYFKEYQIIKWESRNLHVSNVSFKYKTK